VADGYYVYAIATPDLRLPRGVRAFGDGLRLITCGELGVVVSLVSAPNSEHLSPAALPENLLRHERVVEAVCASGAALPVRFGTVLPDAEAVMRTVETHHDALCSDLGWLGDKREVTVASLWQPDRDTPPDDMSSSADSGPPDANTSRVEHRSGFDYLRGRQAVYRRQKTARKRAEVLTQDVCDTLRPHALDCRLDAGASDRLALRAVFLLDVEHMSAFTHAFDDLRQRHQEARFLLSGPWPPYSFVTAPPSHDVLAQEAERSEPPGMTVGGVTDH
jgi:Gas vesicle synthesis protein GvpL/GvpF